MWLWVKTLSWLSTSQIPTNHFIFDHINDLISLLWSYLHFLHEGTNLKLYPTISWLLTRTSIIMIYTVCYLNSVNTKWQHCWNCLHRWRLPVTSIVLMQKKTKVVLPEKCYTLSLILPDSLTARWWVLWRDSELSHCLCY